MMTTAAPISIQPGIEQDDYDALPWRQLNTIRTLRNLASDLSEALNGPGNCPTRVSSTVVERAHGAVWVVFWDGRVFRVESEGSTTRQSVKPWYPQGDYSAATIVRAPGHDD